MTLKMLFDICSMICDKHISKNEKACISYNDEQVRYAELKEDLEKVRDWCYNMNTTNLKQVINCKDCMYYKKLAKYVGDKPEISYSCELDKLQRPPTHYCSFAIPKEGDKQ